MHHKEEETGSRFGFAEGPMLMRVASEYPSLATAVLERVQNGIDKNAELIVVDIDLKEHVLRVRDNGDGLAPPEMDRAINSVGQTIKAKGQDKFGRYGLGLMAYANNCRQMTIISTPKTNPRSFNRWTFDMPELARRNKIGVIPHTAMPALWYGTGPGKVWWRTEICLIGLSGDREKNRLTLDSLEEQIVDRFGIVMRKKGIMVRLKFVDVAGAASDREVVARGYAGIPLGERVYKDLGNGRVFFQLFSARSTSKEAAKGKVLVGEYLDQYRISFADFVRSLPDHLKREIGTEAAEALTSGYFEGEIKGERILLDESREKFKLDEALAEYCKFIGQWYVEVGATIYRKVVEARKSDRYQSMGDRTLDRLRKLIKRGALRGIVRQVEKPTHVHPVTPGTKSKDKVFTGFDDLAKNAPHVARTPSSGSPGGCRTPAPKTPHPTGDKPPFNTKNGGDKPAQKTEESGDGLPKLLHEVMPGDLLYRLDVSEGVLRLNVRHPLWVLCDETGVTALERFQDAVVIQALLLENTEPHFKESLRLLLEEELRATAVREAEGYLGDRLVQGRAASRRAGKSSLALK